MENGKLAQFVKTNKIILVKYLDELFVMTIGIISSLHNIICNFIFNLHKNYLEQLWCRKQKESPGVTASTIPELVKKNYR